MSIASVLAQRAIALIPPALMVPLCCGIAWYLVVTIARSLISAARDGAAQVRTLHQIPCADCAFFTGDYRLKCPVRPSEALSELAICCPDFRPKTTPDRG